MHISYFISSSLINHYATDCTHVYQLKHFNMCRMYGSSFMRVFFFLLTQINTVSKEFSYHWCLVWSFDSKSSNDGQLC